MADIPGNNTTTSVLTVGSSVTDTLETVGDHDWFKLTLTAGQQITITLDGLTLEDPYLRIRDAAGNIIFENDDINPGVNRDSKVTFTAPSSGTFYIDVGAWDEGYTGTYQLNVQPYTPPPLWSTSQVADFLTSGYWGGTTKHFNVTQGGSITVNITALTPAGQNLATQALAVWSEIIGVNFVQVTSGGQIRFDDNEEGAHAESSTSGGYIISSQVNVSTQWLSNYGTGINSYSFQTYIHEIGHALGLGHAGNYNGEADYFGDAMYANDGWPTTVMSYFSQTESTYFRDQNFTKNFITTPMMADILAIGRLYGLSTTTRAGDTTYGAASGWNPNMGAIAIFDSGGTDTIDVSGLSGLHSINLNPETFSNVMGQIGNVSIGPGVIIENATGGAGNDVLRGNAVNNVLTGGDGADALHGMAGNDLLNGGNGADAMYGGLGDDSYYVHDVGDQVVEYAGEGTDGVFTFFSYALGDNVERLTLSGSSAIDATGNALANSLQGNGAANVLNGSWGADAMYGGGGDDTYYVHDAGDQVIENAGEGTDTVASIVSFVLGANVENLSLFGEAAINGTGNELANTINGNLAANILHGGGGADLLNGSLGADTLYGGTGNDIYFVHDIGDVVVELFGEGIDTIASLINYMLPANVEHLNLYGDAITATGNELDNALHGNSVGNAVYGGAGADLLNGSWGIDVMYGGAGDDVYYAHEEGDQVVENAGEGFETVVSVVNYTLSANVENLILFDSAIAGNGNDLANTITGNSVGNLLRGFGGNDLLNGSWGADSMYGGAGDDIYYVHDVGDLVAESFGEGTDTVVSMVSHTLSLNVEHLTLFGDAAVDATGNAEANSITGNNGANRISGKLGMDSLFGGAGADTFVFDTMLNGAANVDRIIDFSAVDDTIALDRSVFTAFSGPGALNSTAFHAGTVAQDASDRILYDSATGNIFYDADGNGGGAAVLFAQITAGSALSHADFLITG